MRIFSLDPSASHRSATVFNTSEILSLQWDPKSDRLLMYGTGDGKVKIWNVDSKRMVCEMETGKEFSRVLDLATSPTDSLLVTAVSSGSYDDGDVSHGSLVSWNLKTAKLQQTFRLEPAHVHINSIVFNHNGNMLVTGGGDGMIRIFDMVTCSPIMGWPAHNGQVSSVRFSSDETRVISAGTDGQIVEWSLHRVHKALRRFRLSWDETPGGSVWPNRWPSLYCDVALDGLGQNFLVSSPTSTEHSAFIYSVDNTWPSQRLGGHTAPVLTVDWHPALNLCLSGSADQSVCVRRLTRQRSDAESMDY
eukprot:TRINITY_DN7699_c0_g1_i3.p1 TRINITY_DN7699_c0_g1~~TRINITY_DN7699_c0_g1_i3.p1  ORF type:complete len:305 (+),score=46.05 TRINITY_DN7699_c0_g1_i3:301-1215(+)